jgi:hypothetical protein
MLSWVLFAVALMSIWFMFFKELLRDKKEDRIFFIIAFAVSIWMIRVAYEWMSLGWLNLAFPLLLVLNVCLEKLTEKPKQPVQPVQKNKE